MRIVKIVIALLLVAGIIFFAILNNQKETNLFEKSENPFEFEKVEQLEDTYLLNIKEDSASYFEQNVVEAVNLVPVSTTDIKVSNKMIFDLKEMFEAENYQEIIVRRGYLNEEESESQGVSDHKTGYDIDVYVKDHEWTDFVVNQEADSMVENSYKYGFVLRYPEKSDYQPWHYRYVGKLHAKAMHDHNLTLSKYLSKLETLEEKQVYQMDENTYLYRVSKKESLVPKNYNYTVSSINENDYIVVFQVKETVTVKKIEQSYELEEQDINDLSISYDLSLINAEYEIPSEIEASSHMVSLTEYLSDDNNSEYLLEEKVLKQLKPMLESANQLDRHTTYVTSAYRSSESQQELYVAGSENLVQAPNHSEHQTGLAFDLSNSYKPNTGFTETVQGLWVSENASQYGFVLRYPLTKKDITKIDNEQWHFRYVGALHATYMKEHNLVLEEYLEMWVLDTFYEVTWNENHYVFYKTKEENGKIKVLKNATDIYYLKDHEYLMISEQ